MAEGSKVLKLCKTNQMAERDGDGWVQCRCGSKHWGLHGAAGLLLVDIAEGSRRVLLQHRAPWVHNGDTWGIPGGARDSHESPLQAALREANEEIGIEITLVRSHGEHCDDHGDWRYDTIVATAPQEALLFEHNHETVDLRWFFIEELGDLNLHPSFAKSWPSVSVLVASIEGGGA